MKHLLYPFLLLALAASAMAQQRAGDLSLTFGTNSVTVNGLAPNGKPVFFVVGHEPRAGYSVIVHKTYVVAAAEDRSATAANAGACMVAGCSSGQIAKTLSGSGITAFGTTNLTNSGRVANALIDTIAAYANGATPAEAAAVGSRDLTKIPDCSLYSDTQ